MNKKGFTLIELITSFALAAVVMIFVFNVVVLLKQNYISKSVRTDLVIKQSILSQKINEDFTNNNVKEIATCDTDKKCYTFKFVDDTEKKLEITNNGKLIKYGDYTYELTNSSYANKINLNIKYTEVDSNTINNSFLVIDLPIYNNKYPNMNFGIKAVYQFNSNIYNISI